MARLNDAQVERLVKLYSDSEKEILKQLNSALLNGNNTDNLKQVLANVRAIRKDLLAGARTWTEQTIPACYLEGVQSTGLKGALGQIHQQAMQVLAENTYQKFIDVDEVIGRRMDDIYRNLALENIRGDVAGYQTWKQTAQKYKADLADKGVTGFVDKAGNEWDMERYTEMVARTATRETMLQGTGNRLLEFDIDLVEIVGGESPKTCKPCEDWDGAVVSLTGKTPGYPILQDARDAGVFHPNCTHTYVAASDDVIEKAKEQS